MLNNNNNNNNENYNNITENSNNDDIQIEINKTPKLYLTKRNEFQKYDNLNQLNIFLENDSKKINSIFSSIKNFLLQQKQKLSQNNIESLTFILKYIENCNFFFSEQILKKNSR